MPRHKPVSDDELVRLMVRIEDIQAAAAEAARRLHATESNVQMSADRASTVANACVALNDLIAGLLSENARLEAIEAEEEKTPAPAQQRLPINDSGPKTQSNPS